MYNISTRIDTINRQLMSISKLQKMEEEYEAWPYALCKESSIYNNFGKLCHCAHRALSLKDQCSKLGCAGECTPYDKRRVPCNAATCKTRRKLHLHKNSPIPEVQKDLNNDLKASKNINAFTKGDSIQNFGQELQGKQTKSDQVNLTLQHYNVQMRDKIIDTYEEKSEQTVPVKDNFTHNRAVLSVQGSNTNYIQEVPSREKSQDEVDRRVSNELGEFYHMLDDVCAKDKKVFERIEKDLLNEKKRSKDLEAKLKSLTCSLNCLKEDSEQRAACLKGALETAEGQTKVAMDLAKQSNDQAELVKADREELLNELGKLQQRLDEVERTNTTLSQERDNLKIKLQSLTEDESKTCEEVEKEVNRMKNAVKEKETALSKERAEFMDMILELTNVITIQKRRICEVTGICSNQKHAIQEKDEELSQKNTEVSEIKSMLQSSDSMLKEMKDKVQHLEYCLCTETNTCECLKQELDAIKENHSSEQRIKEKIIEEQNKTISRQRKLLHDSEEMVQQVASEFDQLKDELNKEKQKSKSLQVTLNETDNKLNEAFLSQCEKCRELTADIDCLTREKQRALAVAKFASQKLHQTLQQYRNKLICAKQQHKYMALVIQKKQEEIAYLKTQICRANRRLI